MTTSLYIKFLALDGENRIPFLSLVFCHFTNTVKTSNIIIGNHIITFIMIMLCRILGLRFISVVETTYSRIPFAFVINGSVLESDIILHLCYSDALQRTVKVFFDLLILFNVYRRRIRQISVAVNERILIRFQINDNSFILLFIKIIIVVNCMSLEIYNKKIVSFFQGSESEIVYLVTIDCCYNFNIRNHIIFQTKFLEKEIDSVDNILFSLFVKDCSDIKLLCIKT